MRANLVSKAEDWRWGSAWRRLSGTPEQKKLLGPWPIDMPDLYTATLNESQSQAELEALRRSVLRSTPYGSTVWTKAMIDEHGLEVTVRDRGRPKKGS